MRERSRLGRSWVIAAAGALFAGAVVFGAGSSSPCAPPSLPTPVDPVDYNWDVRPILSENCFQCHGPDEKARRANLRLDQRDGATRILNAATGRRAIVPGRSRQQRADEARDARERRDADAALGHQQDADAGADRHAAPVDRRGRAVQAALVLHLAAEAVGAAVTARADRALTDIDRFVVRRLQREGLALSPQADKETLINRVTLIADRAAADAGGGRRVRRRTRARLPTRRWSIACWRRRPTASTWPRTGPTCRATPRATGSWTTTTTGCSGRIATG